MTSLRQRGLQCVSICPLLNPVSNDSVNEQHRFRITDRAAGFSLLITESSEGQLMRRCLNKKKSLDTDKWLNISSARLCHIFSDRLQCEPITFFACLPEKSSAHLFVRLLTRLLINPMSAAEGGGSHRRRAPLLHLLLTFPVGQRACRSSQLQPSTLSLRLDKLQKGFLTYRHLTFRLFPSCLERNALDFFSFAYFKGEGAKWCCSNEKGCKSPK